MKISFLGSGQVGGQAAFLAAAAGLGDIALFDAKPGLAMGKAIDIGQSLPLSGGNARVLGSEDWEVTTGSDILVITAGMARKPGMSRQDLLGVNGMIVANLVETGLGLSPDALVIIVTNPINTMTYVGCKFGGVEARRIIGMAGILDNARFAYFVADELGVDAGKVDSCVIGDHGDRMVPVISHVRVSGTPLTQVADDTQIARMCRRARNAGTEILTHLGNSAYFTPGAAICRMLKALVSGHGEIMPCSVWLNGDYGVYDVVATVPVVLGRSGAECVVDIDLSPDERDQFGSAVEYLRQYNAKAESMLAEAVM